MSPALRSGGLDRQAAHDDVSDVMAPAVADRLRLVMVRLARQLRRNDPAGPTIALYAALATLADRGELAVGELARVERLPSSAATRLADQLEEAGLAVRRRSAQDRRSVFLTATAKGRRLVDNHRTLGNAWLAERLERLSEPQRCLLAEAMGLLEDLLAGDHEPSAGTLEPS